MLRANSVPRSHDALLEKRESGFDGVGVNVAPDVDPTAVIDRLVPRAGYSAALHCERIGCQIVRDNHVHVPADVLADVLGPFPRA